jgi:tripartite-type tricarboxylate transporter receptor subunit TctC
LNAVAMLLQTLVLILAYSVSVQPVFAQPAFPSRAITIIVPAAPGGVLDQSAGLVAGELAKLVGQAVVVENKAGASQVIGMQAMARAEPDGYAMVIGSIGPNAAHYALYPKLPYTPEDFAPVAHVVSMPNVLALPQVRQRLAEMGGESLPMSATQFGEFIRAEIDKWAVVVKQAGIKPE